MAATWYSGVLWCIVVLTLVVVRLLESSGGDVFPQ